MNMRVEHLSDEEFQSRLLRLAAGAYNHYGVLGSVMPQAMTEVE